MSGETESSPIDIWVDSGYISGTSVNNGSTNNTQFYKYYLDSSGVSEIYPSTFIFNRSGYYRLNRLNSASSHPVYISFNNSIGSIISGSDGSPSGGITGSQQITFKISEDTSVITSTSDPKITVFCTSHSGMRDNFNEVDIDVICFTETCDILTPSGYKNVSKLKKGDSVITSDNRIVKIKKAFKKTVLCASFNQPYLIPKDFFSKGIPFKDTFISLWHAFKDKHDSKYWMIPHNSDDTRIKKNCWKDRFVTYYNFKLDCPIQDNLKVNGMVCESWFGLTPKEVYIQQQYWTWNHVGDNLYEKEYYFYKGKKTLISNILKKKLQLQSMNKNKLKMNFS